MVYARERRLSPWAQEILRRPRLAHYVLPEALLSELSDREETSEILLLCSIRNFALSDIALRSGLLLLTDRTQNPGNLGSIIRSADAMGADALLMVGHSADVYDPACVRATIGTLFTLPVVRLEGVQDLLPLRERYPDMQWVGTSAHRHGEPGRGGLEPPDAPDDGERDGGPLARLQGGLRRAGPASRSSAPPPR